MGFARPVPLCAMGVAAAILILRASAALSPGQSLRGNDESDAMLFPEPRCTILQNIFRVYGSRALSDRVEAELRGLSGLRNSALVVLYGPVGHCRLKMFCKI